MEWILNSLNFSHVHLVKNPTENIWEKWDTNVLPFTFTWAGRICYYWFGQEPTGQDLLLVSGLTAAICHGPVVSHSASHSASHGAVVHKTLAKASGMISAGGLKMYGWDLWNADVSEQAAGRGQRMGNENERRFNQILADWHTHGHAHQYYQSFSLLFHGAQQLRELLQGLSCKKRVTV